MLSDELGCYFHGYLTPCDATSYSASKKAVAAAQFFERLPEQPSTVFMAPRT
mgnify:CR=1 FL=1